MPVVAKSLIKSSDGNLYGSLAINLSGPENCFVIITAAQNNLFVQKSVDADLNKAVKVLKLEDIFSAPQEIFQASSADIQEIQKEIKNFITVCFEKSVLTNPEFKKFLQPGANAPQAEDKKDEPAKAKTPIQIAEEIYDKRQLLWQQARGNEDNFYKLVDKYAHENNFALDDLLKDKEVIKKFASSSVLRLLKNKTPRDEEQKDKKSSLIDVAKMIYQSRDELFVRAAKNSSSLEEHISNFIKLIYVMTKAQGVSLKDLLNNAEAAAWFDKSEKLKIVKEIVLQKMGQGAGRRSPKEEGIPEREQEREKAMAARRAQREVRDLAKQHAKGQGLQTQLANKGFQVDLRDKDQVKHIVRLGLLKAHPDRGGDKEEAQFFALLKDLNDKNLLSEYANRLAALRGGPKPGGKP